MDLTSCQTTQHLSYCSTPRSSKNQQLFRLIISHLPLLVVMDHLTSVPPHLDVMDHLTKRVSSLNRRPRVFSWKLKFVAESLKKIKTSHFLTCTLSWNGFAERMVQTAKKLNLSFTKPWKIVSRFEVDMSMRLQ